MKESCTAKRRQVQRLRASPVGVCLPHASGIAPLRVWLVVNVHPACRSVNTLAVNCARHRWSGTAGPIPGLYHAKRAVLPACHRMLHLQHLDRRGRNLLEEEIGHRLILGQDLLAYPCHLLIAQVLGSGDE